MRSSLEVSLIISLRPIEEQEYRQLQNGVLLCMMCRVDRSHGKLGAAMQYESGKSEAQSEPHNTDGERQAALELTPGPRCQTCCSGAGEVEAGSKNISADSFTQACLD